DPCADVLEIVDEQLSAHCRKAADRRSPFRDYLAPVFAGGPGQIDRHDLAVLSVQTCVDEHRVAGAAGSKPRGPLFETRTERPALLKVLYPDYRFIRGRAEAHHR